MVIGNILNTGMKTRVISIKTEPKNSNLSVVVLIGNEQYRFTFAVENSTVACRQIQGIRGDKNFLNTFRFNQNLGVEIYQLVSQFQEGKNLELPVEIGDFYLEEARLASGLHKS